MPRTRQQHYVPQFYLTSWCDPKKEQLWALDKRSGHTFPSGPRNVAGKRDAYDSWITLDPAVPENYQYFENQFSAMEDRWKPVFESVIHRARQLSGPVLLPENSLVISESELETLAHFAVVQKMRDMRFRDRLRANWNDWLKRAWDESAPILFDLDESKNVTFEGVDEDYIKNFQMEFLYTRADLFASVLKEKIAVIGFNRGPQELLTSDSPVVTTGYVIHPAIMWDGIDSPSSITYYPLTPDVVLIFFDRNFYLGEVAHDRHVRFLAPQEVAIFNEHLVLQAHERVFSHNGDFGFANQVIARDRIAGKPWSKHRVKEDEALERLISRLKEKAHSVGKGYYTKEQWLAIIQQERNLPFGKLAPPRQRTPR